MPIISASPSGVSPSAIDVPALDKSKGQSRALWVKVLACIVLGLVLLLYFHIFAKLVFDWYDLPDASHGFLIPLFCGFLLWEKRDRLRQASPKSTWTGLWFVVPALALLLVGVLGADLFLSRLSFLVLAYGLVLTLFGTAILREVRFSLLVLLLAIPLPSLVLNEVTLPLQLFASTVSSWALSATGVPVLRDGNVIQLASMKLEVAEACSGIRSLISLLTVAVLFGYVAERSVPRRVLLALASVPIAVAANVVRIYGTGLCVQFWNPEKAMGFFHEFSGWLVFLVSMACLYGLHLLMRVIFSDPVEAK